MKPSILIFVFSLWGLISLSPEAIARADTLVQKSDDHYFRVKNDPSHINQLRYHAATESEAGHYDLKSVGQVDMGSIHVRPHIFPLALTSF